MINLIRYFYSFIFGTMAYNNEKIVTNVWYYLGIGEGKLLVRIDYIGVNIVSYHNPSTQSTVSIPIEIFLKSNPTPWIGWNMPLDNQKKSLEGSLSYVDKKE